MKPALALVVGSCLSATSVLAEVPVAERRATEGALIASGRWLAAPLTLRVTGNPPAVTVGGVTLARDDDLATALPVAFLEADGNDPVLRDLERRLRAHVLSLARAGGAEGVRRGLGRFFLLEPRVRSVELDGAVMTIDLQPRGQLRFELPDEAAARAVVARVDARLDEIVRGMRSIAAVRNGTVRTLPAAGADLAWRLDGRRSEPGIASWLAELLTESLGPAGVVDAVATRAETAIRRTPGFWSAVDGDRLAVCARGLALGDLADELGAIGHPVTLDVPFAHRERSIRFTSARFRLLPDLLAAIAADNALELREDGPGRWRLVPITALLSDRLRERSALGWSAEVDVADDAWVVGAGARIVVPGRGAGVVAIARGGRRVWSAGVAYRRRPHVSGDREVVGATVGGEVVTLSRDGEVIRRTRIEPRPVDVVGVRGERVLAVAGRRDLLVLAGLDVGRHGLPDAAGLGDAHHVVALPGSGLVAVDSDGVPRALRPDVLAGDIEPLGAGSWLVHDESGPAVVRDDRPPRRIAGVLAAAEPRGGRVAAIGASPHVRIDGGDPIRVSGRPTAVWWAGREVAVATRSGRVDFVDPDRGRVTGWLAAEVPPRTVWWQDGVTVSYVDTDGGVSAITLSPPN